MTFYYDFDFLTGRDRENVTMLISGVQIYRRFAVIYFMFDLTERVLSHKS